MRAAERNEDDSLDADAAFHVAILHASGNWFFVNMRRPPDRGPQGALSVSAERIRMFTLVLSCSFKDTCQRFSLVVTGFQFGGASMTIALP
jgi:hypothetical protein